MCKLFNKNGEHKAQKKVQGFFGNTLFASDSMVNLMSTSRKDDLESLMYILCFFHKGTLPINDIIIDECPNIVDFVKTYCKFRIEHKEECH